MGRFVIAQNQTKQYSDSGDESEPWHFTVKLY